MAGAYSSGITDKQWKFVQEYLCDLNATQAALRAGYSSRSAAKLGFQLLENPRIQSALLAERQRLAASLEITPERVLHEYARLAFSDMRRYSSWGPAGVTLRASTELSDDDAMAIAEVSETIGEKTHAVRFKLHDKKGALDSLAKHLDLFHEQANAKDIGVGLAALLVQARGEIGHAVD